MEQTTTKYTIISPKGVRIKGVQEVDIIGLHSALKQEGCRESENSFTDEQKVVTLDNIQMRLAHSNRTSPRHSMDMLICIAPQKILLTDAKFGVKNVRNVSRSEIEDKITESRNLVEDENYHIIQTYYLLFSSAILTPARKNELKKIFLSSPKYQFQTAIEFHNLFNH